MTGRVLRVLALTIGVATAACGRTTSAEDAPEPARDRARLAEALGTRRLIEPRLTGGFEYGPCASARSRVCSPFPRSDARSALPLMEVLAELERRGAPADRAVAALVSRPDDPVRLDRSVRMLEASTVGGEDARALSDLSAVLLVRSAVRDEPSDLLRAIAAARAALEVEPDLAEARFNLAIGLEGLFLRQAAVDAWDDYLEVDADSGWSTEAEDRRRVLANTLSAKPREGRREVRERALEDLLPAWGSRFRSGHGAEAARALDEARTAGRSLARRVARREATGDGMVRAIVDQVDAALEGSRDRLADAWEAYGRGVELYRVRDNGGAGHAFAEAERLLDGSPGRSWATVGRALAAYQQGRYTGAERLLAGVPQEDVDRFPALAGRVAWILGTIAVLQDRPAAAFAAYRRAAEAFDRAGERGSSVAVELRWTAALESQGAHRAAWRKRLGVLRSSSGVSLPQELRVIYTEAAQASLVAGNPEVSLRFLEAALRQLERFEDPAGKAAVLRWRAAALHDLGRTSEAADELRRARLELPEIVDAGQRTLVQAEIDLLAGRLLGSADPEAAVESFRDSIDRFERSELLNLLPRAFLGRARAFRRLGQDSAALADLHAAIGLIESRRAHAASAADRAVFLSDVRDVYEEAADLEATAGHAERAFAIAEALHARVLDDALVVGEAPERGVGAGAAPGAVPLAQIQRALPEHGAILAYLALPGRLLRWLVRTDGIELESVPISSGELGKRVSSLQAAVRAGDLEAVEAERSELSKALLGVGSPLPERLFLVPDGPLHELSFDLLTDPASGRRLIESSEVVVLPSGAVFGRLSVRDRARRPFSASSALVVADPSFDLREFPDLERLTGARAEGAAVAAVVPHSEVLTGAAATPDRILAALDRHPVAHFATHAIPSVGDPGLSYLVLAGGPLYAREIATLRLARVRVVFLSACSSGRADERIGEGLAGLSQAFLEAGASAVIGSLWPVDDRAVVPLVDAFYQHLGAGADPASALQQAKLERLRAGDPVSVWAAFEVIGATAPEGENR